VKKILNSLKQLSPMLNNNSFEIDIPSINSRTVTIYPTNSESNTEKYQFELFTDGTIKLSIDRISDLFFEKEYENFDSLLLDLVQLDLKSSKGYDNPHLIDILPIANMCDKLTCMRNINSTTIKAYFVDEDNSLLIDIDEKEVKYMVYGHTNNKFTSELKFAKNIKDIYNIANAMKYVGRLHQIDILQLTSLSEQCNFNNDRTVEFVFKNNYSVKIGFFESTREWKVDTMKKENGKWVKLDKIITKDYPEVEAKILLVPRL